MCCLRAALPPPRIAAFNSYCPPMIDHLLDHKLGHWDAEVRVVPFARAMGHGQMGIM